MAANTIEEDALAKMRASEYDIFAAYRNEVFDSHRYGHVQYLAVGPANTFQEPPKHYPADTAHGLGWEHLFAGMADLYTGLIEDVT